MTIVESTGYGRYTPCPDDSGSPMRAEDVMVDWLRIIRAEFAEIPGLHLTKRQAQRLWGLDAGSCDRLLTTLETEKFLRRTLQGAYVRADS